MSDQCFENSNLGFSFSVVRFLALILNCTLVNQFDATKLSKRNCIKLYREVQINQTIAQGLHNNPYHDKIFAKMMADWKLLTYQLISFIHSWQLVKIWRPRKIMRNFKSHHFCELYSIISKFLSLQYPLNIWWFQCLLLTRIFYLPSIWQQCSSWK